MAQTSSNDQKKTMGRKSRWTVPLRHSESGPIPRWQLNLSFYSIVNYYCIQIIKRAPFGQLIQKAKIKKIVSDRICRPNEIASRTIGEIAQKASQMSSSGALYILGMYVVCNVV